ncbi:MAG: type II and III secretion system protein family protein [Deltaproteobacteria bacterium]|nr:type II and III secretion system protein family protein [Deltaproteobacteria bacterium]
MKMDHSIKFGILCLLFSFLILPPLGLLVSPSCWGQGPERVSLQTIAPQKLNLILGKSIIIQSQKPIKRVSLAEPRIADAMVLTPHQLYLVGKTSGSTNVTIWEDENKISDVLDLEVAPDLTQLKERLHTLFPEEKGLRLHYNQDYITLSGTVSNSANLSQILSLVEPYAPYDKENKKGRIVNLLQVGGVHQVMLEVRVSEMSRNVVKRFGFNFGLLNRSGEIGLTLLNNLSNLPPKGLAPLSGSGVYTSIDGYPLDPLAVSSNINGVLRFLVNGTPWTVLIDALKENGLLKVLAEPTLITQSGQKANFLAGGEFPIPYSSGLGTVSVEYKPFGVGLAFTPTVLSNGKIHMQVAPEVSELDFSNAVVVQGFLLPSINTRRVATSIELGDGQSFAIAGLLKEDVREVVSKFPVLGDIPILGSLFRSSAFRKNESELIVIVTPHLVKPLDMTKQTLPTDQFVEPTDFEFYLLGSLEGTGKEKPRPGNPSSAWPTTPSKKEEGLVGKFGHAVPQ